MKRSLWLIVCLVAPWAAHGQTTDEALLRAVYAIDAPVMTGPFRLVNSTAYPAFALAPVGMYATKGTWRPAVQMVAAEGSAAVLALGLKRVIRRARPYQRVDGIALRTDAFDAEVLAHDDFAMPSGHATIAFAVATAWTLERPAWYVIVPAYTWATTVAVSRVWHGAHYPSDVFAGAALGTGVAIVVNVLWPADAGSSSTSTPMPLTLRVGF